MGVFDDHVDAMADWMPPRPSPGTFFSSLINDDVAAWSIVDSDSENRSGTPFPGPEEHRASGNDDQKGQTGAGVRDEVGNSIAMTGPNLSSNGGLIPRMEARAGYNAPRLNTESLRPADLSKEPEVRSPYLTIPQGLSPTALLDAPVFLSSSVVLPSPMTGNFSLAPSGNNCNSTLMTCDPDKGKENTSEDINASSFAFKPVAVESASFPSFSAPNESLPGVGASVNPVRIARHFSPFDEPHEDGDQRSGGDSNYDDSSADDGYNWSKYGQKRVNLSAYPRCYYKCKHPNCPVKKKVKRFDERDITEIVYQGTHNHPKPPPPSNRRLAVGSSNACGNVQLGSEQPGISANGDMIWSAMQNRNVARPPYCRPNNIEATSSAPPGQEYNNGYESGDVVNLSYTLSNNENDANPAAMHGSGSLSCDSEGEELRAKRRRIGAYTPKLNAFLRPIREPRVVVQTSSEVDIIDDGYRWHKYGQKLVKGNPNPRSYYKCVSPGCNVRKHVERDPHDLMLVITTYEGRHNHDVPPGRPSDHMNSGGRKTLPTQQSPAASSHIHRPGFSHIQDTTAWFKRPSPASFGLPGRPQLGPDPGFGFGMDQPGLSSLGLASLEPNQQGRLPVLPVDPYLRHQPRPANDLSYMLAKEN